MRDLLEVIDSMLAHIPERSVSFRHELEAAKGSDEYLAPVELAHEHWSGTARVLAKHINMPVQHRQPWMVEVMKVWNADS